MATDVRPDMPVKRSRGPLPALLWLMAGLAAVATTYVLLAASSTREDIVDPWTTLDVSDYVPGERRHVIVGDESLIVQRLTPELLQDAARHEAGLHRPVPTKDRYVMVPVDNGTAFAPFTINGAHARLGCIVTFVDGFSRGRQQGFVDPCRGGHFDVLGRVFRNDSTNLEQPRIRLRNGELQVATDHTIRKSMGGNPKP